MNGDASERHTARRFAEVRVMTLGRRDKPRFVNRNVALQHRRNDEDQRRGCM